MQIGRVSKQANVGIEIIRFYEREGLLDTSRRSPSGYRQYDNDVVARLQFIRRTKDLGFTLAEIAKFLDLWFKNGTKCAHIRQRAMRKLKDIESKISSLEQMKRSLEKLIRQCSRRNSAKDCPLLEGLGEPISSGKA